MVEKEAREKDEEVGTSNDAIGQEFFRQTVEFPVAQTVTRHDDENCDGSEGF